MTSVAGTEAPFTNTYCPRCDRSRSDQNEPYVIQWNTRYELPFGPGRALLTHGVLGRVVGGWAVSAILERNAGQPIRVTYTNVSNLFSSSTYSRPNIVPGVSDKAPGGPHISKGGQYFNAAAFSATPTYSFGTAPRFLADVNGPTNWDLDFMVEKTTRIGERQAVTFRVEMFNTTNSVVFGSPTTSFTSSTFGKEAALTQTNTPRNIQLSARYSF